MESKYSVYRRIRYDRTYRPLGKMSWWRVIVGLALLFFVFLLSGTVSRGFASRGHFITAQKLMISPAWLEKYNPELKAYIDAGALYETGEYEAARRAFADLGDRDSAVAMGNLCALKLAEEEYTAGGYGAAYSLLTEVDVGLLQNAGEEAEYYRLCSGLLEHYSAGGNVCTVETAEMIDTLTGLLNEKDGAQ